MENLKQQLNQALFEINEIIQIDNQLSECVKSQDYQLASSLKLKRSEHQFKIQQLQLTMNEKLKEYLPNLNTFELFELINDETKNAIELLLTQLN